MGGQCSRPRAFRVRTVRGEPYTFGGRELIPVVRVVSFGKARATVGTRQVGGRGGGFVWIQPLAVLEVTPAGERRIALRDGSAAAMRGMLAAAVAMTLFFAAVRWLARRMRQNGLVG